MWWRAEWLLNLVMCDDWRCVDTDDPRVGDIVLLSWQQDRCREHGCVCQRVVCSNQRPVCTGEGCQWVVSWQDGSQTSLSVAAQTRGQLCPSVCLSVCLSVCTGEGCQWVVSWQDRSQTSLSVTAQTRGQLCPFVCLSVCISSLVHSISQWRCWQDMVLRPMTNE